MSLAAPQEGTERKWAGSRQTQRSEQQDLSSTENTGNVLTVGKGCWFGQLLCVLFGPQKPYSFLCFPSCFDHSETDVSSVVHFQTLGKALRLSSAHIESVLGSFSHCFLAYLVYTCECRCLNCSSSSDCGSRTSYMLSLLTYIGRD